MTPHRSVRDPRLTAEIVERRPLIGVRAASGLVVRAATLGVVQDDVLALALPDHGRAIELPRGPDGKREFGLHEKHLKPDLEAALVLDDGRTVLLGSGSLPSRERWFLIDGEGGIEVMALHDLYAALRAAVGAGVELNVEGALLGGGSLRLLQRGNGAGGLNAVLSVAEAWLHARLRGPAEPPAVSVEPWDLGELDGVRLTFTDGLALPRGFAYTAAAEASPDAVADGEVVGSALGVVVDGEDGRWAPITVDGVPALVKVEGIAWRAGELWLSTDPDDPDRWPELLRIALGGPWPAQIAEMCGSTVG